MSDVASERTSWIEKEAVVDELTQALGDPIARKSMAWWNYFFAVAELGAEAARALVPEVFNIEARGGMTTKDGSRRRSPGGVFFVLVSARLGLRRVRWVRCRARRHFERRFLKRFLKLIELLRPEPPTNIEPAQQRAPIQGSTNSPPTSTSSGPTNSPRRAPATADSKSPRPARRLASNVEVVVVRRRS